MKQKRKKLMVLFAAMACAAEEEILNRTRRFWVRPFLNGRRERGDFFVAVPEMIRDDPEYYFETFRMTPETFEVLLSLVGSRLNKEDIVREPISASQRLQMTLAYLVSGDQQKSIAKNYRVGRSTVCRIIHEAVDVIYQVLQPIYLKAPDESEYLKIATAFENDWNFPHCVGAIDGKHFEIPAPADSGSTYFNYKSYFSVVKMASCDADYNFVTICVGSGGSESDAGIFSRSTFGKQLRESNFPLPPPCNVTGTSFLAPFVYVADEAFPLLPNLMRPFPGANLAREFRVYNYRLSRARRIIENCFGILVARWRLLYKIIQMKPEYATSCIQACVVLHNFLRKNSTTNRLYSPPGFVDQENLRTGDIRLGAWRAITKDSLVFKGNVGKQASNNFLMSASNIRQQFTRYFNEIGAVPWQDDRVLYYKLYVNSSL